MDESRNSKEHTIKILLDSGASASIVCKVVLHKLQKILKDEQNKWSTLSKTFNTVLLTELI